MEPQIFSCDFWLPSKNFNMTSNLYAAVSLPEMMNDLPGVSYDQLLNILLFYNPSVMILPVQVLLNRGDRYVAVCDVFFC